MHYPSDVCSRDSIESAQTLGNYARQQMIRYFYSSGKAIIWFIPDLKVITLSIVYIVLYTHNILLLNHLSFVRNCINTNHDETLSMLNLSFEKLISSLSCSQSLQSEKDNIACNLYVTSQKSTEFQKIIWHFRITFFGDGIETWFVEFGTPKFFK